MTCSSSANIFNTGYDASNGGALTGGNDANWQVSGGYGSTSYNQNDTLATVGWPVQQVPSNATWAPAIVGNQAPLPGEWSTSIGNSNWISQATGITDQYGNQNIQSSGAAWYFKYDFSIDPSVDPSKFALDLNFLADNSVGEVWVNGVAQSTYFPSQLPQSPTNPLRYDGYKSVNAAALDLNNSWQTGANSIIVLVYSAPSNMGFDTEVTSTAVCPATSYTVQKSVDKTSVHPGDKVTYTVTVTNTGSTGLPYNGGADAAFVDDLSGVLDDATYDNDASGGGTFVYNSSAKTLSWSTTSLPVGAVETLTYSVTTTGSGDRSLHGIASVPPASASIGSCVITCTTTTPVLNTVTANSDVASTSEGRSVTNAVTANDVSAITSLPLDPTSVTIVTQPSHGTAVANTDGTVTYTPSAGFTGSDSYVYRICDTSSTPVCGTATVTLAVAALPVNTVTANSDVASTSEGQAVTTAVDANDVSTDPSLPLDPKSVTIVTQPSNGTALANANGTVTYMPSAGFTGSDSYVYRICDTSATPVCATATVHVTVASLAFTGVTGVMQTVEAALGYVSIGLGLFLLAFFLRRRLNRIPRH